MSRVASKSHELILATDWADPSRRKLESVKACHERDEKRLVALVNAYMVTKSKKGIRTSENTLKYYGIALRDWINYCWPKGAKTPRIHLLRATEDDISLYIASLFTEGGNLANSTGDTLETGSVTAYLAGVRSFYKALVWAKAIDVSPATGITAPSDPRPKHERRPALPLDDYKKIVAHLEDVNPDSSAEAISEIIRLRAIIRLFGDQGLRISELTDLTLKNIDMTAGLIFITNAKGGKSRTIPMTKSCHKTLSAWLIERSKYAQVDEPCVFVNLAGKTKIDRQGRQMHQNTVRLHLKRLYQQVGIADRYSGAHILRHTAGTRLYRNTRDLYRVAQVLGHSDVNTSSIYAKMDLEGLKDAVASLDDDV